MVGKGQKAKLDKKDQKKGKGKKGDDDEEEVTTQGNEQFNAGAIPRGKHKKIKKIKEKYAD